MIKLFQKFLKTIKLIKNPKKVITLFKEKYKICNVNTFTCRTTSRLELATFIVPEPTTLPRAL
jgi:hypothetical protein